ncbi:Putative uncharacterized protein [Lactobacillus equicursoris DSM 19284 = JCM 14600 = CIP 110162]|jgi:cell division protein FtsL|uniref:DUF4044 domain-containing protein n=2 Tax=Lactobacillus equicursoris TaxID=420645 RepID=K0NXX1_9LACO|nr:DUF4044 domain-containing protein [Lactobacillus equicursoris]MDD6386342.1 DUF4044 domain-containing protein [Lactobacillus equicursoris]MDD6406833.1 DUF4044 domain-containing protein [Lactobacillus equicursoris]MST79469.1 DUF4044 domain-containing protein [Lactobacillus equicursoris]CCK84370.1 Putative uncharacterized protein [Lactobacillus equicursoris 66c]CCK84967.1 Putative uncharacterized protein [Lactobacillus equicursoris DSM 19284 = JCM 14600 = CIP 110162]
MARKKKKSTFQKIENVMVILMAVITLFGVAASVVYYLMG